MLVSFFSKTEYITWVDYSEDARCILQREVEFSPDTHFLQLWDDNEVVIIPKAVSVETTIEKHSRIKQALLSTEDISEFDLEWEQFSDIEIGDIITARIFQGNPYAQLVLQAKVTKALLRALSGTPAEGDDAIIATGDAVTAQINKIRNVFGLGNM